MTVVIYGQACPGMLVTAAEEDGVYAREFSETQDMGMVTVASVKPRDLIMILGKPFTAPGDGTEWVLVKVLVKGIVGYMYYYRDRILGELL